jgi:hypothetical protein
MQRPSRRYLTTYYLKQTGIIPEYSHSQLPILWVHLPKMSSKYTDNTRVSTLSRLCEQCFAKEPTTEHKFSRYMLVQGPTHYKREALRYHSNVSLSFVHVNDLLVEIDKYDKFKCDMCKRVLFKNIYNDTELFNVWKCIEKQQNVGKC